MPKSIEIQKVKEALCQIVRNPKNEEALCQIHRNQKIKEALCQIVRNPKFLRKPYAKSIETENSQGSPVPNLQKSQNCEEALCKIAV